MASSRFQRNGMCNDAAHCIVGHMLGMHQGTELSTATVSTVTTRPSFEQVSTRYWVSSSALATRKVGNSKALVQKPNIQYRRLPRPLPP